MKKSYVLIRLNKRLSDTIFKAAWVESEKQYKKTKYQLNELLKDCTEDNRPNEIDFGIIGKELL